MADNESLAQQFETYQNHLRAVAYRMLGSGSEADDAVQEAWLRLSRSETTGVQDLGRWLTTVVARICLDMLRSRKSRRKETLSAQVPNPVLDHQDAIEPEAEMVLGDSVGLALLVVLETLSPAERVAFVLHDMFDLPFEEIARIVGRSATATRQLASRARRRVKGAPTSEDDPKRHRQIVDAFLAASRDGDFDALMAVLDPDVVLRADGVAVQTAASNRARGAPALARETRGARAVAATFKGSAAGAQAALVNRHAGAVWAPGGKPRAVFDFTVARGKIVEISVLMEPARLRQLELMILAE
jgi:RNA polymerase sigma-70 factor (ECF subfamily)